jgi:hypothetical protein
VLADQCLDRRLPTLEAVRAEVMAWGDERIAAGATITWQFTTTAARTRLHRLNHCDIRECSLWRPTKQGGMCRVTP